jgi:DNA replication and repair protein RecF
VSFLIDTLYLECFRNWERAEFCFDPALTIFTGPNAVGKTNVIEALQLLTEGLSFRRAHMSECVHWGKPSAEARLLAHDGERRREVAVKIQEGRRSFSVNNKAVRGPREITGEIPCVIFTPNDLHIVKDSSSRRRDEIDALGSQLSRTYGRLRTEYDKIVSHRNRLLKAESCNISVVQAWTERLVEVGCALFEKRYALFKRMQPAFIEAYQHIDSSSVPQLEYISEWTSIPCEEDKKLVSANFIRALEAGAEKEKAQKLSVIGPQRDDLMFSLEGREARAFASQGQQRSLALAWKLAEISVVEAIMRRRPLLLLDDVMSELDETRRTKLAELVGTLTQTVITTAHLDYFNADLLSRATVLQL